MASSQTSLSPAATPIPQSVSAMQPEPASPISPSSTSAPLAMQSAPPKYSVPINSSTVLGPQAISTLAPMPQPTMVPQLKPTSSYQRDQPMEASSLPPTSSIASDGASKMDNIPIYETIIIHPQTMGTYQNSGPAPGVHYPQAEQGQTDGNSTLPQMLIVALAAAVLIFLFFTGISIWSCLKRRSRPRAASVTLPSPSSSFGGDLPSSPEKNFSQTPMEPYNSPPSSEKTLYTTPHYNHYEEFDFGPMVMSPTSNTKELVRYHHQLNACLNGGHPSVPTMGGAEVHRLPNACPPHLTFMPKVLLTGNRLLPPPAVTSHLRPLVLNAHAKMAVRLSPPKSCDMIAREPSVELQELINQVDVRIYADMELEDDSFTDSASSSPTPGPATPTGEFMPPHPQLIIQEGSPLHLPLPLPRYNYRKDTRVRQSPSIVS
ncbi:uncharacterized protein VP01_616g4 [Puccinia sorghi]|uniref:Uncharacterized protein n=1 Tax=Puccinia sorghi TaxID=27349 RepID=A0A0L6UGU1_9BASI|nr:uncharacterized protein VP01_616g4 [Puccinia sorghi]